METSQEKSKVLPPNAFRELEPGETYQPVVPADSTQPEVNSRSVIIGLIMVAIFTFAAAYIGLKTGNVIETSIPIAILAVFLGNTVFRQRSTLLQNVIIQSLGQASGVVVAGAIFTIPALYINRLEPNVLQIFLACCMGGFLGVVLLIPLRRYFCKDLHGQLPFPEGTAITNVLATGEKAKGSSGVILLWAFGLGFLYDLIVEFIKLWNYHLNTKVLFGKFGESLANARFELKLNATAIYFGLGYIIGPRYAGVIAAGSVLSYLVLVPLVYFFGSGLTEPLAPELNDTIASMDAAAIFNKYVRPVGIGCIAVAGMIGIVKMGKIIISSLSLAFKGLAGKGASPKETERTDRDISPTNTFLIQAAAVIGMFLLFWYVSKSPLTALIGTVITFVLAFLFTPVAARAIAIVGVNPVSGMTMITLIIACIILFATGLRGDATGQTVALVIGCAVCTALSTSGAFVSDLKVGYWLGASPFQQQRWKYLGIVVASLCVGGVIWVLNDAYGFMILNESGEWVANVEDLPAPQGHLMAAIVEGVLGGQDQPLLLYALGGLVAILLEMAKVPALAFGLGMYLPIYINMAVFAGAGVGWFIGRSGPSEKVKAARKEQGTLIASGLMAGAAIMGTLGSVLLLKDMWLWVYERLGLGLQYPPMEYVDVVKMSAEKGTGAFAHYYESIWGQLVSVFIGVAGLIACCWHLARKGARMQLEEEEAADQ
jgi:putative OPT family oligopeptide transporter